MYETRLVSQSLTEQILRGRLAALAGEVQWGNPLATFAQSGHRVDAVLGELVRTTGASLGNQRDSVANRVRRKSPAFHD